VFAVLFLHVAGAIAGLALSRRDGEVMCSLSAEGAFLVDGVLGAQVGV
jgi:hypothetical protein